MPSQNDHINNCCKKHGCQYNDPNCVVTAGFRGQNRDCGRAKTCPKYEPVFNDLFYAFSKKE